MGLFGFSQKETGAKQQHGWCHTVSFVMYILVPSLQNTTPIFLKRFLIQCFNVQVEQFLTPSLTSFGKRYSEKENAILLYFDRPFK